MTHTAHIELRNAVASAKMDLADKLALLAQKEGATDREMLDALAVLAAFYLQKYPQEVRRFVHDVGALISGDLARR